MNRFTPSFFALLAFLPHSQARGDERSGFEFVGHAFNLGQACDSKGLPNQLHAKGREGELVLSPQVTARSRFIEAQESMTTSFSERFNFDTSGAVKVAKIVGARADFGYEFSRRTTENTRTRRLFFEIEVRHHWGYQDFVPDAGQPGGGATTGYCSRLNFGDYLNVRILAESTEYSSTLEMKQVFTHLSELHAKIKAVEGTAKTKARLERDQYIASQSKNLTISAWLETSLPGLAGVVALNSLEAVFWKIDTIEKELTGVGGALQEAIRLKKEGLAAAEIRAKVRPFVYRYDFAPWPGTTDVLKELLEARTKVTAVINASDIMAILDWAVLDTSVRERLKSDNLLKEVELGRKVIERFLSSADNLETKGFQVGVTSVSITDAGIVPACLTDVGLPQPPNLPWVTERRLPGWNEVAAWLPPAFIKVTCRKLQIQEYFYRGAPPHALNVLIRSQHAKQKINQMDLAQLRPIEDPRRDIPKDKWAVRPPSTEPFVVGIPWGAKRLVLTLDLDVGNEKTVGEGPPENRSLIAFDVANEDLWDLRKRATSKVIVAYFDLRQHCGDRNRIDEYLVILSGSAEFEIEAIGVEPPVWYSLKEK